MCPEGTQSPIRCPLLQSSPEGSGSCKFGTLFFVVIGSACGVFVIFVIVIVVACRPRKKENTYVQVSTPPLSQKTTSGARVVVDGDVIDADRCDGLGNSVIPEDDGPVYTGL